MRPSSISLAAAAVAAVLLAGCGGSGDLLVSPRPIGGEAAVRGTLHVVDGCYNLTIGPGNEAAVVWPRGTSVDGDGLKVDGTKLSPGDELEGGGAFVEPASDLAPPYPQSPRRCGTKTAVILDEVGPAS